jgi:hypothetical protein
VIMHPSIICKRNDDVENTEKTGRATANRRSATAPPVHGAKSA